MQPTLSSACRAAAQFNQSAAANGLSAVRSSVAGVRERTVRSTAAAEAVAELGRWGAVSTHRTSLCPCSSLAWNAECSSVAPLGVCRSRRSSPSSSRSMAAPQPSGSSEPESGVFVWSWSYSHLGLSRSLTRSVRPHLSAIYVLYHHGARVAFRIRSGFLVASQFHQIPAASAPDHVGPECRTRRLSQRRLSPSDSPAPAFHLTPSVTRSVTHSRLRGSACRWAA